MTRKPQTIQPKFKPGDRVAERPKQSIISAIRKKSREIVAEYTTHRRGVVVDNTLRTLTSSNGRTSRVYYVSVLWDGLKTPSQHSQMRICLEEEYGKICQDHYALTE